MPLLQLDNAWLDTDSGMLYSAGVGAPLVALSSGAASLNQGPRLFLVLDSIIGQSFDPPRNLSNFNPTISKGSFYDSSGNKQFGVSARYAENPVRLTLRGGVNNLVSGDEVMSDEWPTNDPLASSRYAINVISSTDITIPGVDGTNLPAFVSGGAASDAMLHVDMALGDYGALTYFLQRLGYPFSRIDGVIRPGATPAQLAAVINTQWPTGRYEYGILHCGRNGSAYDEAALVALRDAMLARCGWVLVNLPSPDATWAGYTESDWNKLRAICEFWYTQQTIYPQIKICDVYGIISDPTATFEAALPGMIGSDFVHPQATGARRMGEGMAASFPPITQARRALSRANSGLNLLASGRFTGAAGTAGSGVTALVPGASVATGWTIGRKTINATCVAQLWKFPAVNRRPSTAYAANDVIDTGDGWLYVVKTGGNSAATLPENAYQGILTGTATYDPASIASGASVQTTVAVAGAALGDAVAGVSFSLGTQGIMLAGAVTAAGTVTVTLTNPTGGAIDLASGTLSVMVRRAAGVPLLDTTVGITDGTLNVYRIPKFTTSKDSVLYQYIGFAATADVNRESMSFFQSIALPAGVNVGDYVRGTMEYVQLAGFCKDPMLSVNIKNSGATQIAAATNFAPNNLQSQAPSSVVEYLPSKTRKLRVPSTTASLELEFKPILTVDGCHFAIAVATLEKTTPPGNID